MLASVGRNAVEDPEEEAKGRPELEEERAETGKKACRCFDFEGDRISSVRTACCVENCKS